MLDTDPEFDRQVRLLSEAGRIRPEFASRVWAAKTDADIDELVVEATGIVDDESEQAWI